MLCQGDDRARSVAVAGGAAVAANLGLAVAKAAIGISCGAVSVTLDAVNNLTDAASSVATVIGTVAASKEADREHPMGHGRIEYVTALVLAMLVTYAGLRSVAGVLSAWASPEPPAYVPAAAAALLVGIAVKAVMSAVLSARGKSLDSPALSAAGEDARMDVLLSSGTLASAVVWLMAGADIEAPVGLAIALFVLRSGVSMVKDVMDDIIGARVPSSLVASVRDAMSGFEDVSGVYDLRIHCYGPGRFVASARIEVLGSMSVESFAALERRVAEQVKDKTGVEVSALGACCSYAQAEGSAGDLALVAYGIADARDEVLQSHGFVMEPDGTARLDVVVRFDEDDAAAAAVAGEVADAVADAIGVGKVLVTVDREVSDL